MIHQALGRTVAVFKIIYLLKKLNNWTLHVSIHQNRIQWKLGITRSLGPGHVVCYIRYFVISVGNKQYKTKEINSSGPEK